MSDPRHIRFLERSQQRIGSLNALKAARDAKAVIDGSSGGTGVDPKDLQAEVNSATAARYG